MIPQPTSRPRQVSFSEVLPSGLGLSMSMTSSTSSAISSSSSTASSSKTRSLPRSPVPPKIRPAPPQPSTPPLQSSTRSYVRSPYVSSHARSESTDTDVFAEDPPGWSVSVPTFAPMEDSEYDKENVPGKPTLKILSPEWGVPRSPEGSENSACPSPSPSRSRAAALPRFDFSHSGTPLTARKPFTPRRLPESPTRRLGRKISLYGIGASYNEKQKGLRGPSGLSQEEDDDDETSFGDDEDADAVDLALDLASLSASSVKPQTTPPRPVAVGDMFSPSLEHASPLHDTATPSVRVSVSVTGPDASFINTSDLSPAHADTSTLPLPPTQMPSAPSTPAAATTGYDSDDSDAFVPRTGRRIAAARRILDSDDDDDSYLQVRETQERPKVKGLKGMVPASIRRLNDPPAYRYLDLEAEDEDSDVSDEQYNVADDSLGSMRDFLNDDEESESEHSGDSEAEALESDDQAGALSDVARTAWKNRPRPRASEAFVRGRFDYSDDSLESLRDFLEGDYEAVGNSDSYRPSSPSTPSMRLVPSGETKTKTPPEVIEILDSSDEEFADNIGNLNIEVGIDERESDYGGGSDDEEDMPPPKTAAAKKITKRAKPELSKKQWESHRGQIAQDFFKELDSKVFESRLGGVGAKLEWSAHLRTSAGNANRKGVRQPDGSSTVSYAINLSTKVLVTEQQIIDTLAHEMCHLAAWVISNELKNPHGKVFKHWGRKVMQARPDIEVTTKHSYEIEYKYSWRCTKTSCAKVYQRHSKSIDVERHGCGACRSKLEPEFETKTATGFQAFLKDNMKAAKAAMPTATHGDVMRALSKRWSDEPTGDHVSYWRTQSQAELA